MTRQFSLRGAPEVTWTNISTFGVARTCSFHVSKSIKMVAGKGPEITEGEGEQLSQHNAKAEYFYFNMLRCFHNNEFERVFYRAEIV